MLRDVWGRGAVATLAVAAIAMTGCGSDDNDSGGSTSGGGSSAGGSGTATVLDGSGGRTTGIGPLTGTAKDEAVAAGEKAAKDAGAKVALPKGKKIGILQVVGGIESADRLANATRVAAKALGYSVVYCDGQGVPATQKACADSLLSQKVDAILSPGVDPSTIASQIRTARSRGVPIIATGGVQPPGYDASYGPNETTLGKLTADRLAQDLKAAKQKPVDVAVSSFPTPTFADRTTEFEKIVKANPGDLKIAATSTNDFANLIEGTRKIVTDQLTQNPNLKAFWFAFDTAGQAAGQLLGSRFGNKTFPDRPLLATFHGDLATIELVRKGAINLVGEVNYDAGVWIGMDQVLEFLARKKPVDKSSQPTYGDLGDLYTYQILDKDHLPAKGLYTAPKFDVVTFFTTKWKNEFS